MILCRGLANARGCTFTTGTRGGNRARVLAALVPRSEERAGTEKRIGPVRPPR